jgi:pimeloyl-ACP methyl ester carboxylesterase
MFGEIRNSSDEKLDYSFHEGDKYPGHIVVIGHGVTGNKDRPFVVALVQGLAQAGIPVLRFSFSGNGYSEGKFTDSTISKEVSDLGCILDRLNDYTLCYAGHSMGGAVGVIRASTDERIKYLISLAGMVDTKGFADREFGDVTPDDGFMWDEPDCPLSQIYMDDMAKTDSVINLASQIKVPWLLVHGTEDDVVPIQDSLDIFAKANEPKALVKLEGSNHVFADENAPLMVEQVVTWIQTQF